jgi:hypothetical protein
MARLTREELLAKAQITAETIATVGKLNPEQADRFIDYVVDESVLQGNARIVRFRNEQMDIPKWGVGTRVAVPKSEATDPAVRRGLTTSKVTLTPVSIMVPVEVSDEFLDYNIEGQTAEEAIIRMFARQLNNNLEELAILGNTVAPAALESDLIDGGSGTLYVKDSYLGLTNGWLKLAESGHQVDIGGANISSNVFSQMLNALPDKYKRNYENLRFMASCGIEQNYREKMGARATAAGDQATSSRTSLTPFGIPLLRVPLLPFYPTYVENATMTGVAVQSLTYAPIFSASDAVLPSALAKLATAAYSAVTDYAFDYTNGTITRDGGGTIGAGDVVKVTYQRFPTLLLTHFSNMIFAIGRDITIEKDRDIYAGTDQYAITVRVDVQFEEVDAVVMANNVGISV